MQRVIADRDIEATHLLKITIPKGTVLTCQHQAADIDGWLDGVFYKSAVGKVLVVEGDENEGFSVLEFI